MTRSMDMKAMMFAGGGLFLSMVATTIWISGDVSRMREEERVKQAQRCALAQQADAATAQTATGAAPASDFTTQPAPQPDSSCAATDTATTAGTPTAIDPATGQPVDAGVEPFDPAAAPTIDPATGQPTVGGGDPTIPSTTDPYAYQGSTGAPESSVVEAGF